MLRYRKVFLFILIVLFITASFLQLAASGGADERPAGDTGSFAPVDFNQNYIVRSSADIFINSSTLRTVTMQALFLAISILFIVFVSKQRVFRKNFSVLNTILLHKTTTERESDD